MFFRQLPLCGIGDINFVFVNLLEQSNNLLFKLTSKLSNIFKIFYSSQMFNKELIENVEILKSKRIVKKDVEISASTGFSQTVVSNYLKGKIKASRNFIDKFEDVYGVKIFANKLVKKETLVPESTASAALMEIAQANKILAESIMVAAQSQLLDAESRKVLVGNNSNLTQTLKEILKSTVDSDLKTQPSEPAISGALLELLAELSVSGKIYRSKQEAVAALGMKLLPGNGKKKILGTPAGVGR